MKTIHVACQYFLNHDLEEEVVRQHIKKIAKAKYQCVYAHSRAGMITPYFSEKWWNIMRIIAEECQATGLKFGVWDEDYYPSGMAGGRIVLESPEFVARELIFTEKKVYLKKDESFIFNLKNYRILNSYMLFNGVIEKITQHCGTVRKRWISRNITTSAYTQQGKVAAPHWRSCYDEKAFALEYTPKVEGEYTFFIVQEKCCFEERHSTDLLNAQMTTKLLEITHENYKKELGEQLFKNNVASSFLDEPSVGGFFAWTPKFANEFEKDHGYSIMDNLYHIRYDIDDNSAKIRYDYRETQRRLLCENYLGQIQKWCQKNNILSVGHLTRMEHLSILDKVWPNQLRCCKYIDIPCADPLGAVIGLPDSCGNHTALKVASSAAHIFNKKQCGSDCLAVVGCSSALRDFKFILDYHLVLGINYFNLHGLSYSLDGPRKDEVPPSLFIQHSEWELMPILLEELQKKAEVLTQGEHLCEIAVLYPSTSFIANISQQDEMLYNNPLEGEYHKFVEELLRTQNDFDFVDEITLLELENFKYKKLILYKLSYITEKAAKKILELSKIGVEILLIETAPQILGKKSEKLPFKIMEKLDYTQLKGANLIGKNSKNIFIHRRKINNQRVDFLVNRSEQEFIGTLDNEEIIIGGKNSILLYDLKGTMPPITHHNSVIPCENWQVTFKENTFPLTLWQDNITNIDMLNFHSVVDNTENCLKEIKTHFMFEGELPKSLELIFDQYSMDLIEKITFNEYELKEITNPNFPDHKSVAFNIAPYLITDNVPRQNKIKIFTKDIIDMPYLRGHFTVNCPHNPNQLPYLSSCSGIFSLVNPVEYHQLGYSGYSDKAIYSCNFQTEKDGDYLLDLGEVSDAVRVKIDNVYYETLIARPYRTIIKIETKGLHKLELEVFNSPANRDRLAHQRAGLNTCSIFSIDSKR